MLGDQNLNKNNANNDKNAALAEFINEPVDITDGHEDDDESNDTPNKNLTYQEAQKLAAEKQDNPYLSIKRNARPGQPARYLLEKCQSAAFFFFAKEAAAEKFNYNHADLYTGFLDYFDLLPQEVQYALLDKMLVTINDCNHTNMGLGFFAYMPKEKINYDPEQDKGHDRYDRHNAVGNAVTFIEQYFCTKMNIFGNERTTDYPKLADLLKRSENLRKHFKGMTRINVYDLVTRKLITANEYVNWFFSPSDKSLTQTDVKHLLENVTFNLKETVQSFVNAANIHQQENGFLGFFSAKTPESELLAAELQIFSQGKQDRYLTLIESFELHGILKPFMSKKDNHENPLYLSLKTSYETLEQGLQSKQQLYQAYGEKAPQDENVNKIIKVTHTYKDKPTQLFRSKSASSLALVNSISSGASNSTVLTAFAAYTQNPANNECNLFADFKNEGLIEATKSAFGKSNN